MTTVVGEIKGVLSGVATALNFLKRVESSEALQERFDEASASVHREVQQVSYAVCRALVAHALGRDPSADEVDQVLSAAVSDPAFPHRAYRLLGEMRKSASHRRRAFLAAMLFGLPFAKLPDDERDRVDMVVERIMPADVELLGLVVERERTAGPSTEEEPYLFRGTKVAAMTNGLHIRIATTNEYERTSRGVGFPDSIYEDERQRVDHAAFAALLSLGCIELGEKKITQGEWAVQALVVTPLGACLSQAIEELRPGFEGP